jgi:hypothetical protein
MMDWMTTHQIVMGLLVGSALGVVVVWIFGAR